MHQESPPGNNSNRSLSLLLPTLRNLFAHLLSLRNGVGFVVPEFVDSDFPGHGIPPPRGMQLGVKVFSPRPALWPDSLHPSPHRPSGPRKVLAHGWGSSFKRVAPNDAVDGKAPQGRPQKRLDRRLEEVSKAVVGGYCWLQMPLQLAFAVRET